MSTQWLKLEMYGYVGDGAATTKLVGGESLTFSCRELSSSFFSTFTIYLFQNPLRNDVKNKEGIYQTA